MIESSPTLDDYENPTTQEAYDNIFLEEESSEEDNEALLPSPPDVNETSNLKPSTVNVEKSQSTVIENRTIKSISSTEKIDETCNSLELYKFEKMTSMLVDSKKNQLSYKRLFRTNLIIGYQNKI